MSGITLIQDLAVVLLVAGIAGWIARRLGLSSVVGYLLAGLLIGPHTPPFSFVDDQERIHTLSEVGVVFLMFSVGMGLSLQRLKRLGLSLILATAITALLVFNGTRFLAMAMGWSELRGMFFAAMFMVSSSAIISKVLSETGESHEKYGQRALGITVLEDIVAVFMMTLLTSRVAAMNGQATGALGQTLWLMLGFVVLSMVVGLLVLPRLFRVFNRQGAPDLVILFVAGILFGAAMLADLAGYSLALGAFLFGTVVAETASRETVERSFSGAREMFSAVFFVSIGMLIEPISLWNMSGWILFFSVFVIVLRLLASTVGLSVTGAPLKDALKSGLTVIPIGEFSYIIAQLGVDAKVLPDTSYSLAVGVSLLTAVAVPLTVRQSGVLAGWVDAHQPAFLRRLFERYHVWLEEVSHKQRQNIIWQHSKRRLAFALAELLIVGGLVGFSLPLYNWLGSKIELGHLVLPGWQVAYWVVLTILVVFPLGGMWKSLDVLAMLLADVTTRGSIQEDRLRMLVERGLRVLIVLLLLGLLLPLVPIGIARPWEMAATATICVLLAALLWKQLGQWHRLVLGKMEKALSGGDAPTARFKSVFRYRDNWNTELLECTLPDDAQCSGQRIIELALRSRFGCSIVQLERQGVLVQNPTPELSLFPGDKLLLFGSPAQVASAQRFLHQVRGSNGEFSTFDESELGTVLVPDGSSKVGQTLAQLDVFRNAGVQILAIDRGGSVTLNPGGGEVIQGSDSLLVLGTAEQIRKFFAWLDS